MVSVRLGSRWVERVPTFQSVVPGGVEPIAGPLPSVARQVEDVVGREVVVEAHDLVKLPWQARSFPGSGRISPGMEPVVGGPGGEFPLSFGGDAFSNPVGVVRGLGVGQVCDRVSRLGGIEVECERGVGVDADAAHGHARLNWPAVTSC